MAHGLLAESVVVAVLYVMLTTIERGGRCEGPDAKKCRSQHLSRWRKADENEP